MTPAQLEQAQEMARKCKASNFKDCETILGTAQNANAGTKEDALAAYNRKDYATALSLLRPLATQGDAWAQFTLGFMYQNGQGVPKDAKETVRLYGLAATQGNASAQISLGNMYRDGQGVPQDYVRAQMWFLLSVANGYSDASQYRDEVAKKLNSSQIQQAQEMAQRCQASSYKQCD